jgi:hypothetical protein
MAPPIQESESGSYTGFPHRWKIRGAKRNPAALLARNFAHVLDSRLANSKGGDPMSYHQGTVGSQVSQRGSTGINWMTACH